MATASMATAAAVIRVATDLRLVQQSADVASADVADRGEPGRPDGSGTAGMADAPGRPRGRGGSDRLSVVLFSVAAFLAVFALLVSQLPPSSSTASQPFPVLRKIIVTRIIETIVGGTGPSGTSVSQSVSGSSSSPSVAAPTTHTS